MESYRSPQPLDGAPEGLFGTSPPAQVTHDVQDAIVHPAFPMTPPYDALLLVSFGGPEKPEDVLPFLETVLRGRDVPRERLQEVASHYHLFGGASPINAQNRKLIAALEANIASRGPRLPVYWGNRNWHPFLADTLRQMTRDGIRRALAFVTSAYGSYSGCRQYREDIEAARAAVGPMAPEIEKLRLFYDHPGFVEANTAGVEAAFAELPEASRGTAALVFTAHSLPAAMATSCRYEAQVRTACRLVGAAVGRQDWSLAFQSRSGPPGQPWLEPEIGAHLAALGEQGVGDVVVAPIGFISDHMEVVYDLDVEVRRRARELGVNMARAATPGTHPAFVSMVRELILEKVEGQPPRRLSADPDRAECFAECCPAPARRPTPG